MTITLRQESQAGTTTKGSSLTYAELDNNFIDILTNKILPLQVNADTGVVTVGQAQSNGVFTITGDTGVTTTVTESSAGDANLSIALTQSIIQGTTTTIYAKCSEAISVGDVVMFAGVQGDHLLVKKAVIDDSAGAFVAEYIVGIAADNYALNDFAYIVTQGEVTHANLNTNSYAPGTILWYDPTTSGGWTSTEPSAPNPKVRVAAVLKQNATDGILLVRPTFSRRITDAEDVDTEAAVNNDYLVYNSATGVWQHQALDISTDTTPQLGGTLNANSNNFTNVGTINTHTVPGGTGTIALTSDIPTAYTNSDVDTHLNQGTAGAGEVLSWTGADYDWVAQSGGGIANVVEDTTPQLGGDLDSNGNEIKMADSTGLIRFNNTGMILFSNSGSSIISSTQPVQMNLNSGATQFTILNETANILFKVSQNGVTELYHGTSKKFETASGGVSVTGTLNGHTIPGGTGTFALTSDITSAGGDSVQAGDNIEITSPDSAGGKTIALRNPLNQPVVAGDQTFSQINFKDYSETVYTAGTATGTITPDVANGNVQRITLTGNITFNALGNPAAGQSLTLIVQQPASGGPYTLSSTMKFAGGTKTLSTGASEWDIITVFYDGTNYFASLSTNFS